MWRNAVIPAVVVLAFWLVSSLATTYFVRSMESSQAGMAEDLSTIQSAGAMRYTLRHLQDAVLSASQLGSEESLAEVNRLSDEFRQHLRNATSTSLTHRERELVRVIDGRFQAYSRQVGQWLTAISATRPATAAGIQRLTRLADTVAEPCKQLSDVNEKLIHDSLAQRRLLSTTMTTVRMALLVTGPTVGILCGFWMARRLHRSIARLSITLNDAASDLAEPLARIDIRQPADLPQLHEQAQAVAVRIRGVVEELQRARRDALTAARLAAVGELAAGLAHELRNPLTSVKLLIQTAAQRPGGSLPPRTMEVVQQEIARMESTIERLMHFARPPRMNRLPHDVRDTAQRSINLVAGRAAHAGIDLRADLGARPMFACADAEQLHQALVNLLINGIEAMERGGSLRVRVETVADRIARIAVEDQGPGVPPELIDRIFEPFVTGKKHGTGLGLAISRRIIDENGGTLSAANRPEGGAAFTIDLPLVGASLSEPAPQLPEPRPDPEERHAQAADRR